MATSNDLLIKQRSVIEFLAAEGCSAANIHAGMKTVYVHFRLCSSLMALKLRLRRVRRDKDSILQHDNARPHTSRQTQDALEQLELTTLPHPALRPDLAPSDYYLFPQLKKYLKGHHYDNDEEVIADVRRWCRGQSSEFFADGVLQLVKRWRLCVDRNGDYVEK
ncbi:histone-lysine N-methyltransferase SETMAR [Plakobranchus ocellatus]|uniref:Histone-lysine N-methyltransferase SETMAR n=1 Tax=Plakobranchus ocellatus TaxID=259542 RepID=A0AAV3ZG35_9GAST|nr:histone-lysine N-methyltransferase SETMAR [Plakobranchus ocellatus]